MKEMINEYEKSCSLVKQRIRQLTQQRNELRKKGRGDEIIELDLERRIHLLYVEHEQMSEIILHLSQYMRRREQSVKA